MSWWVRLGSYGFSSRTLTLALSQRERELELLLSQRPREQEDQSVLAPASNHCLITARSSSVMPVELLIGITLSTTTCW